MVVSSPEMSAYFERMNAEVAQAYAIAKKARALGYDPERTIPIPLAQNMAERVEGLISSVAPQIVATGITERIVELEKEHGALSWKVALIIAKEVADQKFCTFTDTREAIEVGIRTGFAYHTVGVVAAPLEGFVELKIKKRADGKDYFALLFSGPIRGAGGTASTVCLIIADYVRKQLGYAQYDPTEKEVKRIITELYDYHDRVTNLQYKPSEQEIEFIAKNLPVEVSGDPTERIEVSNHKDLPRIETNKIRGGVCLVISMVALKAPKLWKELGKWGDSFSLEQWNWVEEFLQIQKAAKSGSTKTKEKRGEGVLSAQARRYFAKQALPQDTTFIADLVSGRPVLTHPKRAGGFRLRYGRSRVSGYSSVSIHPATMGVLNDYIALGTQLKMERPGKAASTTSCTTIEGPIVKLTDGTVKQLHTYEEAKAIRDEIKEVIYLGDILISYGDFLDRAHALVPVGYTEEQYAVELADHIKTRPEWKQHEALITSIIAQPHKTIPTFQESYAISKTLSYPQHPRYTPYYAALTPPEMEAFLQALLTDTLASQKRALELLGIDHDAAARPTGYWEDVLVTLKASITGIMTEGCIDGLEVVTASTTHLYKDKDGITVGARMGRPEKAKMRKLTGSPHCLFPVGDEGGRMRSFQTALAKGFVTARFSEMRCSSCDTITIHNTCETCGASTTITEDGYSNRSIDLKHYFKHALEHLDIKEFPDLIKGVRGTMNKTHMPEHLAKGILRATHDVHVNKDGTIRYDMTELPITHFKPKEIYTTPQKLVELGYVHDIHGKPLIDEDQVLEIKPQDIILGASPNSPDEGADEAMRRIGNFVDELLVRFYKLEPYYRYASKEDVPGTYVIGLAPHTSAGILGRVIGFSHTQSMLCHPLYHAAMRRDTDGDESCIIMLMDGLLNFSRSFLPDRRGSRTMDAPLVLTAILDPAEVDDMVHKLDIAWTYPAELYEKADESAMPWEASIDILANHLATPQQYEGMGYTHDTEDINLGATCSDYKLLPSMQEKLYGQMDIAQKVRAVDKDHVAFLVIEKHLIRDIKGNLRKFSIQKFRCVACNEKYRRIPLKGVCTACGGKLIFTISQGSIVKYLEPAKSLVNAYELPSHIAQSIDLLDRRIIEVFGKDKEKQLGLGSWF